MTGAIGPEFLALQEVLAGRYSLERELGQRPRPRAGRWGICAVIPERNLPCSGGHKASS